MFRNILYSLFTKGMVAIINFLVFIFSSRYLGVSSRGEISIFLLNIAIIQVVNDIYTGYGLIHFVPKFNLRKTVLTGLAFTVFFCGLGNILIVALQKQVTGYSWIGYIITLLVLFNTFFCVLILSKQNLRLYNLLSFLQPLLLLLGILISIFVLHEFTIKAYVFPLFFSFLLATLISGFFVVRYLKSEVSGKLFEAGKIFWHGFIYQLALLLFIFVNKFSFYLLPDSARVGLYASACALAEAMLIIPNGIAPVLLAKVANEAKSGQVYQLTLGLGKTSLALSLFIMCFLFLIPQSVYVFVLGVGFAGIKEVMMLYAPGVLLISFFTAFTNFFNGSGKHRIVLYCYGMGACSTLLLAPHLIEMYEVRGAAITALISYSIVALSLTAAFFRSGNMRLATLFSFNQELQIFRELLRSKK